MDVKWTSEQKKVIDLRDRDILVSAAAGSGKTAVLVERIVNRICVDNPPVDIDRMLVVTFTKAAAAEMRERVSRAIDSLKEQKPDDENLQRQSTLVHNALITDERREGERIFWYFSCCLFYDTQICISLYKCQYC